jgi:hypothetical protein
MHRIQKYVFFTFFIGCVAVVALLAAKGAQGQSTLRIARSCSNDAGIPCKLPQPIKRTILICLKGQAQE